jgi:hypothetical protein
MTGFGRTSRKGNKDRYKNKAKSHQNTKKTSVTDKCLRKEQFLRECITGSTDVHTMGPTIIMKKANTGIPHLALLTGSTKTEH